VHRGCTGALLRLIITLEDATPQERAFMLAPIPLPIKLLLRTIGARQYRRYVKEVRGVEPGRS
jgi:hypothetical protein